MTEFLQLIRSDNALPTDLCISVFFSYSMYDEALLFLFCRKEYQELLTICRQEFERSMADKDARKKWCGRFVKYC